MSVWRSPSGLRALAALALTAALAPTLHSQGPAGSIELISVTTGGIAGGGESFGDGGGIFGISPSKISAENRYVVFASASSQLVAGDLNAHQDIFVRDRQSGVTMLVSLSSGGAQGNGDSFTPVISADGRYVAFASDATNLTPGDGNGATDIFVRDLQTGTTSLVSASLTGGSAPSGAFRPAISADGRFVAFQSFSDAIVPGDTNVFNSDIFVRDVLGGTTQRVSLRPDGSEIIGASSTMASISADGRRIAFAVANDPRGGPTPQLPPNLTKGIYVRDLDTNQTILVSARPDGTPSTLLMSIDPMISANGRYVSFTNWEDLDPNFPDSADENDGPYADVFVRDVLTSTTRRASLPFPGGPAEESGGRASISADGRYVAYFDRIRDMALNTTTLIKTAGGVSPNDFIDFPTISDDGLLVYFESAATNLAANDTNGATDIYVFVGPPRSGADLSLTLQASTLQPKPNTDVTLTAAVSNAGPDPTNGVAARLPLPAGVSFVSDTGGGSYNNATGIWTIGALTSGASASLQIVGHFTAPAAVDVIAQVSASTAPDPDSTPDNDNPAEDDQKTLQLKPGVADLSLTMSANTLQPAVNSNVTLTVSITDAGPVDGTVVAARVPLSAGLTFVFASPPGAYDSATGVWTVGTVPNSLTQTLTIVARVTSAAPIDVTAQISAANELDPDSTPNNSNPAEDDQATIQLSPVITGIVVNDGGNAISPLDGKCTLIEAILAANDDKPSGNGLGECAGGNGPDIIHLRATNAAKDVSGLHDQYRYTAAFATNGGAVALPLITSDITIEGGGADVHRQGGPPFRLFTVAAGGALTLNGVAITGGQAVGPDPLAYPAFGGAVLNIGTLVLNGSSIVGNSASSDGGGISTFGPLTVRGSVFQFNTTGGSGGAIDTYFAGPVTIDGTTIDSNVAPNGSGGGVNIYATTTAAITNSVISANTAKFDGGGLLAHVASANVSMTNTRVTNNVVVAGHGGGISNGRLQNTSIPLVAGGTMTLNNVTVANNRATEGYGGGIANGGVIAITGGTIADNLADSTSLRCGGGLMNAGSATLTGVLITRNATTNGAGGGACSGATGPFLATNTMFSNNNALKGQGGGVAFVFAQNATLIGSTISGNSSVDGGGLFGVGFGVSVVTLDNTVVQGNAASAAGGGLYLSGVSTATLGNNSRVLGNVAGTAGGGVVVAFAGLCCWGSFSMTGGTIDGNIAAGNFALVGGGGGIANLDQHSDSRMALDGVRITNNRAPNGDGGGIFNRGMLSLNGGTLRANSSQSGGGIGNGISGVMSGGTVTLTNTAVEANVASSFGGGLFNAMPTAGSNTIVVDGGSVRNNRAASGGGIFLRSGSSATIRNQATIAGNNASTVGGGISNAGQVLVDSSTISGNTADFAGGLYNEDGLATLQSSTLSGNRADRVGGIFVFVSSTANIVNSTISGNVATSAASNSGGALDVTGILNLSSSTIAANTGSPGGIANGGFATVTNTIVAGNNHVAGSFAECVGYPGGTWASSSNLIGRDANCFLSTEAIAAPLGTNLTIDPTQVFTSLLAPLGNAGGPTATHALQAGSLAIDSGLPLCEAFDQRREPRPADGDGVGGSRCDIGAFEQQTPLPGPAAVLTVLTPRATLAGVGNTSITVTGSGFAAGSVASWNGQPRATYVASPTRLTMMLVGNDLNVGGDLNIGLVTVQNPGTAGSNALPLTIVSGHVSTASSVIVPSEMTGTAAVVPRIPGQRGPSATLTNNDPASGPVIVTVATYSANPAGATTFNTPDGFFDVQVIGADPSDSLVVNYYYSSALPPAAEAAFQLRYWSGTAWAPVLGSGGAAPVKNTLNNLDGTSSGGRVTMTFDNTSTPKITELAGTVFALATESGPPRISTRLRSQGVTAPGSGVSFFDLYVSNTGSGDARNLTIAQLVLRTLSGSGAPSLNAQTVLPIAIGALPAGASTTVRLYVNVPATVSRLSLTINGSVESTDQQTLAFSAASAIVISVR